MKATNPTPKTAAPIRAQFLISPAVLTDPTLNKFIPRATRKTLRLSPAKRKTTYNTSVHTSLTDYIRDNTTYRTDAYHNQNLIDPDPLTDEFGDIDNEYEGLTITEPMNEAEMWKFCTGYDVI